ncbi:hypothetical protein D0T90_06235 [Neisseria animalis]|uniref:Uncharacterized protein n=1 Tax=Neisseria animalis TaxID=492 RepID=A0A5P3MTW3_NEIAN|nr:hypothetical protein D0T90_06235 [Neisseria animalis]ROW31519.1 hypothetical protein CGZ60_09895 [Neisseria animalis]
MTNFTRGASSVRCG